MTVILTQTTPFLYMTPSAKGGNWWIGNNLGGATGPILAFQKAGHHWKKYFEGSFSLFASTNYPPTAMTQIMPLRGPTDNGEECNQFSLQTIVLTSLLFVLNCLCLRAMTI